MRMQTAKHAGYDVTLRYVAVETADMNIVRVNARAANGGHWIDPETVRQRAASSLANLPAAIAIADRSTLLDNSGENHRLVLKVEAGRIGFLADPVPGWLERAMPRISAELTRRPASGLINEVLAPDPFGDRATRGYLRNVLRTNDVTIIAQIEAQSFKANVASALDNLERLTRPDYGAVLDTHKVLFGSVYPWAGQDRAALGIGPIGIGDRFSKSADARAETERALALGLKPDAMRERPGEVFGRLAHAHPFLDGNGRTLLTIHADLARRAGVHFDWSAVTRPDFLRALSADLRAPGTALDDLLRPAFRVGPLPTARAAAALEVVARRTATPSP